jgi:hypothetical protein
MVAASRSDAAYGGTEALQSFDCGTPDTGACAVFDKRESRAADAAVYAGPGMDSPSKLRRLIEEFGAKADRGGSLNSA